jgi:hypothetical protein
MKLLEQIRGQIEKATLRYETADELSEILAEKALDAWGDMEAAFLSEQIELDRIDKEENEKC